MNDKEILNEKELEGVAGGAMNDAMLYAEFMAYFITHNCPGCALADADCPYALDPSLVYEEVKHDKKTPCPHRPK